MSRELVTLSDIFDIDVYHASKEAGFISTQTHPSLPYTIHNYSKSCTWENAWNEATLACRGLITNNETGEVLARPFSKFFNHNQPGAPVLDLSDKITVTDKVDGSMGLLFPIGNGAYAIATRGSFASDQAVRGTKIWNEKYRNIFTPNPAWSYLFEIIFPENRIVINYGDLEDLILLGVVNIATGQDVPLSEVATTWPGRVVATFPYQTYEEALLAPARENAEGFVLFHHASGQRVKIKQEDYIRLHRILTNVNARSVWELLAAGENPVETFADAPDEFHTWLKAIIAEFESEHARIAKEARDEYEVVLKALPEGWSRKDYAMAVLQNPLKVYLFALLDGKDISPIIWDLLRPVGLQASQKVFTEDIDE